MRLRARCELSCVGRVLLFGPGSIGGSANQDPPYIRFRNTLEEKTDDGRARQDTSDDAGRRGTSSEANEERRVMTVRHLPHRARRRYPRSDDDERRVWQRGRGLHVLRHGHEDLKSLRLFRVVVIDRRVRAVAMERSCLVLGEVRVNRVAVMMGRVVVVEVHVHE
jgi:hypothetical protein